MPGSKKDLKSLQRSKNRSVSLRKLTKKQIFHIVDTAVTHDGFFKNMISNIARARAILKWILSEEKAVAIDWSHLKKEQESFLDKDMKNSSADAVFKAPIKMTAPDGAKEDIPCYLFFVLEHKSTDCYKTVFQILRYVIRIWERDHRDHNEKDRRFLPFVVPIIFHNGARPFKSPSNLRDMIVPVPSFEDLVPNWPVILIDLQRAVSEEFPKKQNADLFLDTMKSILTANGNEQIDRIIKRFRESRNSSSALSESDLYSLLLYVSQRSKKLNSKIMEKQMVQATDVFDSTLMMSAFDRRCMRFRAEGEARGLLRCVKIAWGQPDKELEKLILRIRNSDLIEACYDSIESGEIKNHDELKVKIRQG